MSKRQDFYESPACIYPHTPFSQVELLVAGFHFNTEDVDEGVVTQSKKDFYCRENIPEYMQQVFYAWGQW